MHSSSRSSRPRAAWRPYAECVAGGARLSHRELEAIMVLRPLRPVSLSDATSRAHDAWLSELDGRLSEQNSDWYRVCRDTLFGLWYPGHSDYTALVEDHKTPLASRAAL